MSVVYELLDNLDDLITVEGIHGQIYIEFAPGVDQMGLSVDKARQLLEYLKQAIADVEGGE